METPKMVIFVVKRYAVREAKKRRYAVRKAKKRQYAVRKGGGGVTIMLVRFLLQLQMKTSLEVINMNATYEVRSQHIVDFQRNATPL